MIIKLDPLKTQYGAEGLIHHLLEKPEDNEEISVIQGSGERIKQDYQMSKLALCPDAVLHVKLSPGPNEKMDDNRWNRARDVISGELGVDPALATVVQHTKKGRTHQHIIFPAFDFAANKKINIFRYKMRCQKLAKILEKEFKHAPTPLGYYGQQHVAEMLEHEGKLELSKELLASKTSTSRGFTNADAQKVKRFGYDASELKEQFTQLLEQSDNEKSYQAALKELGFRLVLVKGKRARYEFHSIKEPKLTLNATRLLKVSKSTLIKHLNGDYHHEKPLHEQQNINTNKTVQAITHTHDRPQRERPAAKPQILRETRASHTSAATTATGTTEQRGHGFKSTGRPQSTIGTTGHGRTITDRITSTGPRTGSGFPTTAVSTGAGSKRKTRYDNKRFKTPKELVERLRKAPTHAEATKELYRLNSSLKIKIPEFCSVSDDVRITEELSTKILGYYARQIQFKNGNIASCRPITEAHNAHLLITTKTHHIYRDYGNKITSPSDVDTKTAQEIVKTLKNRGCKFANITGTSEYKDEIAIQCALNDIPCNHELSEQAQIKLKRIRNKIESKTLERLSKRGLVTPDFLK